MIFREVGTMRTKLTREFVHQKPPFVDHHLVEEEDVDLMEDRLNGSEAWEIAFEKGEKEARFVEDLDEDDWE